MSWRTTLFDHLTTVGERWFKGRYALDDRDGQGVAAIRYRDPDFLRAAVASGAELRSDELFASVAGFDPGEVEDDDIDIDLRIAVIRFVRHYTASISGAAFTALANGVGLDLRAENCSILTKYRMPFTLNLEALSDVVLTSGERPTTWEVDAADSGSLADLRAAVWRGLYADHLVPFFDAVHTVARVSHRMLWTNAAEWAAMTSDMADENLTADHAAPFVDDRMALLDSASLPGVAGPNPMVGLVRWDPVDDPTWPHGIHMRLACCLNYRLPERLGRLCQNCVFLPLEERLALMQERHGVAMGTVGGSAEERAKRRGIELLEREGRRP